jgi:predicted nicotinamide N-methyase
MIRIAAIRFEHGPLSLELEGAPDFEAVVAAWQDPERFPYWSVLWDSAVALGRELIDGGSMAGTDALELGCGLGLPGLCAAAMGARVVQTDRVVEAVAAARRNAARNGLPQVRHVAADWRWWPLHREWPLVFGSDLLYERSGHTALLDVLDAALRPSGEAWIADPGRPMTRDFARLAERRGWRVHRDFLPDPGAVGTAEPSGTPFLLRLRKQR